MDKVQINYRDGIDEYRLILPARVPLRDNEIYYKDLVVISNKDAVNAQDGNTQIVVVMGDSAGNVFIGPAYQAALVDLIGEELLDALRSGEVNWSEEDKDGFQFVDSVNCPAEQIDEIVKRVQYLAQVL